MAPASIFVAQTPYRAFGGLYHRVTSVMGTEPVPAPPPDTVLNYPVPPGPTGSHSAAAGFELYPTWSAVARSLPRVLPWAGHRVSGTFPAHGGFVPSVANPPQDAVVRPAFRIRTGARQGRVTTAPKPLIRWPRQGG